MLHVIGIAKQTRQVTWVAEGGTHSLALGPQRSQDRSPGDIGPVSASWTETSSDKNKNGGGDTQHDVLLRAPSSASSSGMIRFREGQWNTAPPQMVLSSCMSRRGLTLYCARHISQRMACRRPELCRWARHQLFKQVVWTHLIVPAQRSSALISVPGLRGAEAGQ